LPNLSIVVGTSKSGSVIARVTVPEARPSVSVTTAIRLSRFCTT